MVVMQRKRDYHMEKLKKASKDSWAYFAGLPFLFIWLPMWIQPSGSEWLPGWPAFIGNSFYFWPIALLLPVAVVIFLRAPTNEKYTKKKKTILATLLILCNIMLVGCIAAFAHLSFFGYQKVDRYITSPSGKNKAVILTMDYAEQISPVKKRFFYENNNYIFLHPEREEIMYNWLDDNTLEITRTWKLEDEDGEIVTETDTEQLNW